LAEIHPHLDWFGHSIGELEESADFRVAFLTRLGEGLVPDSHTVLQDGDLIHIMVRDDELAKVEAILGKSPEA
jgi:trk system potassium uptake protein TrkA